MKGLYMWLDNLKLIKKEKGLTSKQIALGTDLPERSVSRIFSGETLNPTVDTLRRIASFLGTSLDEIFAEGTVVIGCKNMKALQDECDELKAEKELLLAENAVLKNSVASLKAENDILNMKLAHKDELLALHNYYIKKDTAK